MATSIFYLFISQCNEMLTFIANICFTCNGMQFVKLRTIISLSANKCLLSIHGQFQMCKEHISI